MRRHSSAAVHQTREAVNRKRQSGSAPKTAKRISQSVGSHETEVARFSRELAEPRQEQTATADVLGIISSSPGELEPVFTAILENAVRLCDAKFGTLFRFDGEARGTSRRVAGIRRLPTSACAISTNPRCPPPSRDANKAGELHR
jgi:hypothetical protein